MRRKLVCLLLLLTLAFSGCARSSPQDNTGSQEAKYLTRVNIYSKKGALVDQYQIDYDLTGMPVKISSGIREGEKYENKLGGAPVLPAGVKLDETEDTYKAVLLAPCDDGTALLVSGTAQEPLWGMVLYGDRENYEERHGYLTKVTANDGTYIALFYSTLSDAAGSETAQDNYSFAVTEDSDYHGYDLVLSTLGAALIAMEGDAPVVLNEMLFSPLYDTEPNKHDIGYAFIDLDDNGTMELLIGSSGQYARPVIYDLYTVYNGRIVNVLSGTDGNRHTLSTGNEILLNTRNEEGQNVFAVFSYYNSSLRLLDAVISGDGERYRSSVSFSDDSTFEEISLTEAAAIEERYTEAELEFTPLYDFMEDVGISAAED
ncbi:MAG: hypothetical protein IJ112_00315 [Oscillospiraceae bacterium]|nr:hypothetical protein [Oscillospiraceae bacterium]